MYRFYQFIKYIVYYITSIKISDTLFRSYKVRLILMHYIVVRTTYRENMDDIYFLVRLYNSLNRMNEVTNDANRT